MVVINATVKQKGYPWVVMPLGIKGESIEITYIYSTGKVGWITSITHTYSSDLRFFVSGDVVGIPVEKDDFRGTLTGLSHVGSGYTFDPAVHTHKLWYTDDSLYFGLSDRFLNL